MTMTGDYYLASHGETFDAVAFALWKDETYARYLLEANPELDDVMVFSGGEMLRIPEIDAPDTGDYVPQTAPWKE